jgi:hypothetical protein
MARIVPAQLPKQATRGEERLFALLQQLPKECVVYYEPFIGKRCPDFLLISPTQGLLIIEIKSWHAKDLVGGDSYSVVLQDRGQPVTRIHPVQKLDPKLSTLFPAETGLPGMNLRSGRMIVIHAHC